MKKKPKRKKPGPLAPIDLELGPIQLELPDFDLAPLELDKIPELKLDEIPEVTLEKIELPEIKLDDLPEPDLKSLDTNLNLELEELVAKQDKVFKEMFKEPRKRGGRQRPAR
jgi:hypothetical protein